MRTQLAALVLVAICSAAIADELELTDGSTVIGPVLGETDTAVFVKTPDGSTLKVERSTIKIWRKSAPEPKKAEPAKKKDEKAEREAELRRLARAAFSSGWVSPITKKPLTQVPVKTDEGELLASPRDREIDLETATVIDKPFDEAVTDLYGAAKSPEERYQALRAGAGVICWARIEVTSTSLCGEEIRVTASVESKLRRGLDYTVTLPGDQKLIFAPGAKLMVPMVLTVAGEARINRYLAGEDVEVPVSSYLAFAPIGSPPPVEPKAAAKERKQPDNGALLVRVKAWLLARKLMKCQTCHGTGTILVTANDRRKCDGSNCAGGISTIEEAKVAKKFGSAGRGLLEVNESTIRMEAKTDRELGEHVEVSVSVRYLGLDGWYSDRSSWALRDGEWKIVGP